MPFFGKVTIFALFVLLWGVQPGCGPGRGYLGGKHDHVGVVAEEGGRALDARAAQAVRHYREGDLEAAATILEEVLAVDPMHPQALEYRRYLDKVVYCTVYPGDTLSEIAQYYYDNPNMWPVLMRANGLNDPRRVGVHTRLRVPWYPSCDPGKDELGRLQGKAFRGRKTEKVLLLPAGKNDTLESLAREYYGDTQYRFFLADYNLLETRTGALAPGRPIRVPVLAGEARPSGRGAVSAVPRRPETACLETARTAIKNLEFAQGCRCLAEIPCAAPEWQEAEELLNRCRTEGVSHYESLGDASLQASDPEAASRHWQSALSLDPENERLKNKLQETRDLMKTLELLSEIR